MPNTTKRQRHAKSPAKTIPITAPAPQPVTHIPYFNPNETSQTHELVIDAVATMLSFDSDSRDVDMLLTAAMKHTRRRTFTSFNCNQAEIDARAEEFAREELADWKADIVGEWRKNRNLLSEEAASVKTITDKIRENARRILIGSFEYFMSQASNEEIRFLANVFMLWDSRHRAAESKDSEIYIAGAFESELESNTRFLRVPERLTSQVQQYIDALRAVEGKAAA
jgi:hypothetical protein